MPELCRFYGIIIRMFWADHPPPHFHAIYGSHEALVEIQVYAETADLLGGGFDKPEIAVRTSRDVAAAALRRRNCWCLSSVFLSPDRSAPSSRRCFRTERRRN